MHDPSQLETAPEALDYLLEILARDGGGEERLESQEPAIVESIRPTGPVPDEKKDLVERTIGKIADRRPLDPDESFALEAIIIPDKRPAIDVLVGDRFSTDHQLWLHLNQGVPHDNIAASLASVGRVELPGHPSLPYGGTGFVVGDGLLMTNRHVAEIFARGVGVRGLNFLPGQGAAWDPERRVDGGSHRLAVTGVAMIHPYWDMALLKVEGLPSDLEPLRLAVSEPQGQPDVVAIGYPAFDPRNDAAVQHQVFRGVYNVKRLMPGKLTARRNTNSFGKIVNASTHDSSTLGGASGSAVLMPVNRVVAALHFGGAYRVTNYGVPAFELAGDGRVIDAGVRFEGHPVRRSGPWDRYWADTETPVMSRPAGWQQPARPAATPHRMSVTIPVTVTVEIGGSSSATVAVGSTPILAPSAEDAPLMEAPVDSYRDRRGYQPDFLGPAVQLPQVVVAASDVLEFMHDGKLETELRYEHFSVKMSRERRLCFFSAVNIDGAQSRKSPRTGWRLDPRIPAGQQIINECYGNPPRFSRGHMTRREDPVWGDTETANRANADSMHVTNTTPQMQAFNSPIWLALEDFALGHARADAMRISVFTGPYFSTDDPVLYGVRTPVSFWKVIAFIHDQTGQLCATGYEMSQKASLPTKQTEFVFGEFLSPQSSVATQTSLRVIEARSGLSFGGLADFDPKSRLTESILVVSDVELEQLEQIRFF